MGQIANQMLANAISRFLNNLKEKKAEKAKKSSEKKLDKHGHER